MTIKSDASGESNGLIINMTIGSDTAEFISMT